MKRTIGFVLPCLLAAMLVALGASNGQEEPSITATGNGGVCSLSALPHKKHTFKLTLTGWRPSSNVQVRVSYGNGEDYPVKLKNNGVVRVDSRGDYTWKPWPCWPNQFGTDKVATYIVSAVQLPGTMHPQGAFAGFRVVK